MGLSLPFSVDADFSGISAKQEPLKIDKIIQKTFINVTEEGTEAAAATAGKFFIFLHIFFSFLLNKFTE